MPFDPVAVRKIEALIAGRALPTHTHARFEVQPHALAVSAIPLSGEDSSLHAVACGWLRSKPQILTVPDPRVMVLRERLFETLGLRFERLAELCLRNGTFPQLVLTTGGALDLLRNIADDHRFFEWNSGAARFARQLTYFTDRAEVETQQAVIIMTELLTWHWATPLNPVRELDLGMLLAAIGPGPDGLERALERAALTPMGAGTDYRFDNQELLPLLSRRKKLFLALQAAERRRDPRTVTEVRRQTERVDEEIHHLLSGVVLTMNRGIRQGMRLFHALASPELPEVSEWVAAEKRAFARYQQVLSDGKLAPIRDKPRGGAFRLIEYEAAIAHHEAAVELGDGFGRIRSLQAGRAIRGRIENVAARRTPGTRRVEHTFDLVSDQEGLTLRVRDEMRWAEDTRLTCVVTGYTTEGDSTRISLRITEGMQRPGPPPDGFEATLVRKAMDVNSVYLTRNAMSDRLGAGLPWTHVPGATGFRRSRSVAAPADPLRAVLELSGGKE